MKTPKSGLLTTGQAAKLCGVTADTVLKWIKAGKVPASRTAGGHFRISLPELTPFLTPAARADLELDSDGFTSSADDSGEVPHPQGMGASPSAPPEETPCWEYLAEEGDIRRACRQCVVYRVRATRCFLMAGLDSDVGHARQFCEGSCEDCVYYRRLQGLSTRVLFITSDEELMTEVDCFEEGSLALRFARSGYEASALVETFRPEVVVIDLEDAPEGGYELLDAIAADPRVPGVRVVLVAPAGRMGKLLQRPRHRLVAGMVEKPQLCARIEEVVKGSAPSPESAESRSA